MILAHLIALIAMIATRQVDAFGILIMLVIEMSQIPVIWKMKMKPNNRVQTIAAKERLSLTPDVGREEKVRIDY
jgi:ABC-type uncharacterized transport system permease subunit